MVRIHEDDHQMSPDQAGRVEGPTAEDGSIRASGHCDLYGCRVPLWDVPLDLAVR